MTDWLGSGNHVKVVLCSQLFQFCFGGKPKIKLSTPNRFNGMTTHYYRIIQMNSTSQQWGTRWKYLKELFVKWILNNWVENVSISNRHSAVLGHCRKCVKWETKTKKTIAFSIKYIPIIIEYRWFGSLNFFYSFQFFHLQFSVIY